MLMNTLRILVNNSFKESFYKKEIIILIIFFIFYKKYDNFPKINW